MIISSNSRIEQVIIFGSRAKGNYWPGSDIDLAVVGGELKFDLVLYHQIKDDEVLDHIRRIGFFLRKKKDNKIRKQCLT